MQSNRFLKIAAASAVLAAATGCATVPGDPYYSGVYAPTPIYGGTTVYESGVYPVYPAYPVARRDREDRWEDMRNDRDRRAWKERQEARERAQWQSNQRDRDLAQRQQRERDLRARQLRERELARAQQQQQQQQRRNGDRNDRNADGSPRTDYDRYNPKTGSWLPRGDQLP